MNSKLFGSVVLAVVIWLLSNGSYFYNPPNFFPLDNYDAEYRITKKCPKGQGWDEESAIEDVAYCIEYRGSHILGGEETTETGFFRITVGNSEPNLEKLLGQRIKNINGKFSVSNKQCIQEKCRNLRGTQVVLDIDQVQLYE